MDKAKAKLIREAADKALAPMAEELGLQITVKSGTFDGGQITFKVEFAEINEGGIVKTKEATDFEHYAHRYGMTAEHLGATFESRGETFTIVGCKPRATKMPILAKNSAGKGYKFNDADVCRMLGIERPTPDVRDFQARR